MQTAMVLTGQKPTHRNPSLRPDSRGSAGVHQERGMREEKRQELGRPWRFLIHSNQREKRTHGMRILSHTRGNPDTEVGRTLNVADAQGNVNQVGEFDRKIESPTTSRESDQPIVLGDGRAVHRGKGLTGIRSLHREH